MIRWLAITGLILGAGVVAVGPAAASMAAIVTVAPVGQDESEAGLKAAAASALSRALRAAQEMGLPDVLLRSIRVVPGAGVVVEIVAFDSGAGNSDREWSRFEPDGPRPPTL
jgi:hypothetical protein